jgi:hypothetical protein
MLVEKNLILAIDCVMNVPVSIKLITSHSLWQVHVGWYTHRYIIFSSMVYKFIYNVANLKMSQASKLLVKCYHVSHPSAIVETLTLLEFQTTCKGQVIEMQWTMAIDILAPNKIVAMTLSSSAGRDISAYFFPLSQKYIQGR